MILCPVCFNECQEVDFILQQVADGSTEPYGEWGYCDACQMFFSAIKYSIAEALLYYEHGSPLKELVESTGFEVGTIGFHGWPTPGAKVLTMLIPARRKPGE